MKIIVYKGIDGRYIAKFEDKACYGFGDSQQSAIGMLIIFHWGCCGFTVEEITDEQEATEESGDRGIESRFESASGVQTGEAKPTSEVRRGESLDTSQEGTHGRAIIEEGESGMTHTQVRLDFSGMVKEELELAREGFPALNSAHEAYAVIQEELDEFWEQVKRKKVRRDYDKMLSELVQIAAMCQCTAEDLNLLE